jgi:hypothetical protein
VRQKRLPNDQTNLAERIGLASRYYIKNILSSDQLIPDEAKNELTKESVVNLLQLNAIEVAMQLMVDDFTVFRTIGKDGVQNLGVQFAVTTFPFQSPRSTSTTCSRSTQSSAPPTSSASASWSTRR